MKRIYTLIYKILRLEKSVVGSLLEKLIIEDGDNEKKEKHHHHHHKHHKKKKRSSSSETSASKKKRKRHHHKHKHKHSSSSSDSSEESSSTSVSDSHKKKRTCNDEAVVPSVVPQFADTPLTIMSTPSPLSSSGQSLSHSHVYGGSSMPVGKVRTGIGETHYSRQRAQNPVKQNTRVCWSKREKGLFNIYIFIFVKVVWINFVGINL
jgi:hypothetical protein